jgi:hypothetical protein
MNSLQVFGLQVALSFVVCGLVAKWYVSPRLASLPLSIALPPLLVLHAFRHLPHAAPPLHRDRRAGRVVRRMR